jgi:cyclic pyranopterin phosphate synthase
MVEDRRIGRVVYAFEAMDEVLTYMPLAARRVLDASGRKLSLAGWQSLPIDRRWMVARAGAAADIPAEAAQVVDDASPCPDRLEPIPEPSVASPPPELDTALGEGRVIEGATWRALRPLDRYALVKSTGKAEKLSRAYDEIVRGAVFSHLTARGEAHMIDVGAKPITKRRAVASARVSTTRGVIESIADGTAIKGDVLAVARVAGILASKRTAEIIPLCHPIQTTHAAIEFELQPAVGQLKVTATVEAIDRTGVEMEALVAASVAALTIYDMIKSADRWATIDAVRLDAKSGGRSGDLARPPDRGA